MSDIGYMPMFGKMKRIIEDTDTFAGKLFDVFIQSLIIYSLITFSIETLPELSERSAEFLWWSEVVVVVVFTIEYILRIGVSERKWKFIFSFYGLIDLLAILPFYVARGLDLRAVRIFRMIRILRMLKLIRYSQAIRRMKRAFVIAREELVIFSILAGMVLYASAVGIYFFEHESQPKVFGSVFHSLWWVVSTLTTVGYGDAYPITVGGKVFTFFVLMIGIGLVAVPTGLIASALTAARREEQEGEKDGNL